MRSLSVLLVVACLLLVPCLGCGNGRPDPSDREDFIDTTDPDAAMQEMEETEPGGGAPADGKGGA